MRILPFYLYHTFINSFKKLFRSWVSVLIVALVVLGVGVGIFAASFSNSSSNEDQTETSESSDDHFTEQDANDIIEIIISGASIVFIMFSIYGGDKSGASIFKMPDVNFLFAAPMKPQSVLLFRTIMQAGIALLSSLYLLFQLPNLMNNAGLSLGVCFILFFTWFLIVLFDKLFAVLTYTIAATHEKLRKYIRPFAVTVIGVIVLIYLYLVRVSGYGLFEAAKMMFASKQGRYIPLFGWLRGMTINAINGEWLNSIFYLVALVVFTIVLIAIIWSIKADFYEDAFSQASKTQETLDNAKSGGMAHRTKERKEKIKRNESFKGEGAYMFLEKAIYNRSRFSAFGFFSKTMGTYFLVAVAVNVFMSRAIGSDITAPLGFILAGFVFFRNLGNPIATETEHNFLYMVPENPHKKVLYSILAGTYETALDLIPAVIVAIAFAPQRAAEIIFWYILWVSFDIFCSCVGTFTEIALPVSIVPALKAMIIMSIRMISILPAIIIISIGIGTSNMLPMLACSVLINLAFSGVCFGVAPTFLHKGR